MRLEYYSSVTRILLAAVQTRNPFEGTPSTQQLSHTPSRPQDDEAERKRRIDERVATALKEAKDSAEQQRQQRIQDAESRARWMAYGLNSVRSRETNHDGEEAALFDSMAWSSSRMAAVNRLAVHTGHAANSISGEASTSQGGETASFSFTGTVGQGVGRGPSSEDARPVDANNAAFQGTNYRLTTGNGNDVLTMQLASKLSPFADGISRVTNAQVFTGGGNDAISLNAKGHDTSFLISSGSGDDTVTITSQSRSGVVNGGSGNDRIIYAGVADTIATPGTRSVTINGGEGDDVLTLSGSVDADVSGGSGADTIDLRDLYGRISISDVSDDHISANSSSELWIGGISGTSRVDMSGNEQKGLIRFTSLQRDQVDISSSGESMTITEQSTGASITFNNVAGNFASQLRFYSPPPPPSPPSPPPSGGSATPSSSGTVTTVVTQSSTQAGKAGGTATSGGSLGGSGSISSHSATSASSSGKAQAEASVKIVTPLGPPLELSSRLEAKALDTKA